VSTLKIERMGGLGGFGLPGSRIRSRGTYPLENLSAADQAKVQDLFKSGGSGVNTAPPVADGFRYKITRDGPNGPETVEVPESAVPQALQSSVKDELE
jgi:hypothetical protein